MRTLTAVWLLGLGAACSRPGMTEAEHQRNALHDQLRQEREGCAKALDLEAERQERTKQAAIDLLVQKQERAEALVRELRAERERSLSYAHAMLDKAEAAQRAYIIMIGSQRRLLTAEGRGADVLPHVFAEYDQTEAEARAEIAKIQRLREQMPAPRPSASAESSGPPPEAEAVRPATRYY